ncbi:MAG: glycosyltransferase family 39 protein [Actinomycetota bacterium]|nr:glycosyltransferase family 39 protein [Actinomycetota bacterium]
MPEAKSSPFGWVDLAVVPLVAILAVPTLLWFGDHPWAVLGKDAPRYLFAASEIVSGGGLDSLAGAANYNGGHGPVFPALIGSLILLLGRDTEGLIWAMRLTALLNPPLAYLLAKRLSGPPAGLLAAALLTLFGFNVRSTFVLNIDVLLLTFTLLALLALLAAVRRGGSSPALALLSGLLLGASVLTKETAVANLPLALLAVLLLGWPLRAALWHYLGVALACGPWWAWRWSATGEVYLVDRLPPSLQLPVMAACAILLGLALAAYASGTADRFLAGERRRRWAGRFLVVAWAVPLTVLTLATAGPELAKASPETVGPYLAGILAPTAAVVPVLLLTIGYTAWMALRRAGPWRLLALALLFQVPVCLFVVVEGWDPRQFLVAQALLFCALGALVTDAGVAAWRGRGYAARLAGAAVAILLTIFVLAASVQRVQGLLPEDPARALAGQQAVAPQASAMADWTTENVPEGERILVNTAQGNYLAYLDGGRHEWTFLKLDQEPCVPKPNIQTDCDPDEGAISRIPTDAVWVQAKGGCEVISLSMPNLMEQVRRTGSGYVMISGSPKFPGILGLPTILQRSGAFEIAHSEGGRGAGGVVLLKSTGRPPEAVPTLMNRSTVANLGRCEETKRQGYENWLRSRFPHGILRVTVSG